MKVPSEKILPQPHARRLRIAELRTLAGAGGVLVVGVDAPAPKLSANERTIGLVELPEPTSSGASLADQVAEAVVAKLTATGVIANMTLPTSSMSAPARSAATVLDDPPPILLTTTAAAKLLGCSVKALYHRVAERQVPSSCIVRSGRRILFHRERLLAAIERKAGR